MSTRVERVLTGFCGFGVLILGLGVAAMIAYNIPFALFAGTVWATFAVVIGAACFLGAIFGGDE